MASSSNEFDDDIDPTAYFDLVLDDNDGKDDNRQSENHIEHEHDGDKDDNQDGEQHIENIWFGCK